jgi:hypothetical protein
MSFDKDGRKYAYVHEVKKGTVLIADGGFTCMSKGSRYIVDVDEEGPYVQCKYGKHYLDGQVTMENPRYVDGRLTIEEPCYLGLYLGSN